MLAQIGLSLPVFIKWDDSEYGLRAKEAGFPTVTFPGAAVWHVPWTDKNDALDWQAYFHHRNRFIAALLHSGYPRGGRLVRESLNHQIKHLVSMQYSTVELRHQALERRARRAGRLHERAGDASSPRSTGSARGTTTRAGVRPGRVPRREARTSCRARAGTGTEIPGRLAQLMHGQAAQPLRQLRKPRELAKEYPEAEIMAQDAKWYRMARYDSAIVSMPDGTAAAFYRRDPRAGSATCSSGPSAIHRRAAPRVARPGRATTARRCRASPRRRRGRRRFAPWLDGEASDD